MSHAPNESSENHVDEISVDNPVRIIPGPAGVYQRAKLRQIADTREGGEVPIQSTQEYMRKVVEDVGEDEDFTRVPWLSAVDYVNANRGLSMDV